MGSFHVRVYVSATVCAGRVVEKPSVAECFVLRYEVIWGNHLDFLSVTSSLIRKRFAYTCIRYFFVVCINQVLGFCFWWFFWALFQILSSRAKCLLYMNFVKPEKTKIMLCRAQPVTLCEPTELLDAVRSCMEPDVLGLVTNWQYTLHHSCLHTIDHFETRACRHWFSILMRGAGESSSHVAAATITVYLSSGNISIWHFAHVVQRQAAELCILWSSRGFLLITVIADAVISATPKGWVQPSAEHVLLFKQLHVRSDPYERSW